ncbi:MAG: glutamate--tRNA ligase [Saprospiraceae bacterium]|nr:glutamate--tRNA ligase [Saprospiraceae bacterium]
MTKVRVRFAPSPTGPLHIGGVRTALYNYLFAKKHGGDFLLRIEDTDQTRYVPGAEQYIMDALDWLGLTTDEDPKRGGAYGPYRQSERKEIYIGYAMQLVQEGKAYYAFDTSEELELMRAGSENDSFKYGVETRMKMRNSESLSKEETEALVAIGDYAIRMKIPAGETISFEDEIRGHVAFASDELDDKIILKADGMPTYHLANIVDDHLMEISHVIRGEEWLSSTAHHMLLYRFFDWTPPSFSHLPLILKPTGQGKLSKRDGAKFGFPVFPLNWQDTEEAFPGFKEEGFMPQPLLNFLALLGWSPGNDIEVMTMDQMITLFDLHKIVKGGAKFDIDKARWFNQQYIISMPSAEIAQMILPQASALGFTTDTDKLALCAHMMKERVGKIEDILNDAYYLFEKPKEYDNGTWEKKYKPENKAHFEAIAAKISESADQSREHLEMLVKSYISDHAIKMGEILPILRIALTGTMQGPDLFDTMTFLGGTESGERIVFALNNI